MHKGSEVTLADRIKDILDKTAERGRLEFDQLPDIDLYMDQVTEYLSRNSISPRESDRLSSAMINNYIKDGILPRANGKKYSREHIAYLIMISCLKQTLSVKDTGALLERELKSKEISEYFNGFTSCLSQSAEELSRSIPTDSEQLCAFATRLAIFGYLCRVVCEAILSDIDTEDNFSKPKSAKKTQDKERSKEQKSRSKKESKKKEKQKNGDKDQ